MCPSQCAGDFGPSPDLEENTNFLVIRDFKNHCLGPNQPASCFYFLKLYAGIRFSRTVY